MKFRHIGPFALALLLVTPAAAATTYSYKGNTYTDVFAAIPDPDFFTTSMAVTGSISFSSALPANSTILAFDWLFVATGAWTATVYDGFVSAAFSNGASLFNVVNVGDQSPAPPLQGSTGRVELTTGADGNIAGWSMFLALASGINLRTPPFDYLESTATFDRGSRNPYGDASYSYYGVSNVAGSWSTFTTPTVVPVPGGAALLFSGLGLLALLGAYVRSHANKTGLVGQPSAL